ncbi:hypothetical protein [Flavobacterium microcysteis]|uniref:Uncharacterized protein n=1 Tax=Flavobacterium microcysteis TaxID=2596891 RepID=A0A501QC44_9FLAO|nr:hypothetical protein [Flavobacterium microcysteis]TPD70500.1 hypothetical protein FJA49_06070 [Flavobacterium microcysteis]
MSVLAVANILGVGSGGASLGFNTGNSQIDQGLQQTAGSVISGLQETILGNLTGTFNSTFGSVFANGLDLSCWNSSYSPSEAKTEMPQFVKIWLNESGVLTNPSSEALSYFSNRVSLAVSMWNNRIGQSKYAKCTKDGWRYCVTYAEQNLKNVLTELGKYYNIQEVGKQPCYKPNDTWKVEISGEYMVYKLTAKQTQQPATSPIVVKDDEGNVVATGNKPPSTQDSGGFNPLWLLPLLGFLK